MLILTLGGFLQGFLATVFVGLCFLLTLIILIQKPRGGGLSGAFGGGGGGGQVFGGKSGDILTWITVGFFIAFILAGMGLVAATRSEARKPAVEQVTAPATLTPSQEPLLELGGEGLPPIPPPTESKPEEAPSPAPSEPPAQPQDGM